MIDRKVNAVNNVEIRHRKRELERGKRDGCGPDFCSR